MISNYFICDHSAVNEHIDNLENSLEMRSNLLFDFINNTVYNFGPQSYDYDTSEINKINFEMWRQETYAIMTNDIDVNDMTEIELDKCNMFWNAVEQRNLLDDFITTQRVKTMFNLSPVTYQLHYIEILETENNVQPHGNNIEFDSEEELSDNDYLSESESEEEEDYTPEEALDIINNMSDEDDGISDAETVIVDSDEEENLSYDEDDEDDEDDEAANIIIHIRNVTNNDPAAIMRIIHTLQNYAQTINRVNV
jgi:hypothetical protein